MDGDVFFEDVKHDQLHFASPHETLFHTYGGGREGGRATVDIYDLESRLTVIFVLKLCLGSQHFVPPEGCNDSITEELQLQHKGEKTVKIEGDRRIDRVLTSEVHQSTNRRTAGCRTMLRLKECSHGCSSSTWLPRLLRTASAFWA